MQAEFDEKYHHIEVPTVSMPTDTKKRILYVPTQKDNLLEYYQNPLFWYLSTLKWTYKRKLDGSNLRVKWDGNRVIWHGKTNKFGGFKGLAEYMAETFPEEIFEEKFGREKTVLLFGEYMGPRIQGNELGLEEREFILFDVKIGNSWLAPENVEAVAKYFWLKTYADFGERDEDTLLNLISRVAGGEFKDWEGIVCSPSVPCLQPNGGRVICKIKNKDYLIKQDRPA